MKPISRNVDTSADAQEALVAEAVDEFLDSSKRGHVPDVEEFARRYPSINDVLRNVLPALNVVRQRGLSSSGATSRPSRDQELRGCIGDYRIIREIGRGGMGVVYEAEQISLQRIVALKVLPFAAALDTKRLERFKNEAQAAARLHHSHIVPVHAVGCERGVYYYAMQMIEGESLADVIAQLKHLSRQGRPAAESDADSKSSGSPTVEMASKSSCAETWDLDRSKAASATTSSTIHFRDQIDQSHGDSVMHDSTVHAQASISTVQSKNTSAFFQSVAELGIQAAEALEHAHGQDVVHRDIKPANLLVDGRGNLWVTDFGLARLLSDAGLTVTGDVVGTFRYMSPEQASGKTTLVDHRTDIYSLGATLYELVALKPVFDGNNREELLKQVTLDEPVAPRRHNRSVPTDLETIILKCMAKEPESRYETARDVADDLRRFIDQRPIRAKRPTLVELASKWSRRHMPMVTAAAVVLLLAVIGLTVSNLLIAGQRRNAEEARKLAEAQRRIADENLKQADEMLRFFWTEIDSGLANNDTLQPLRRTLLQETLTYYQRFISKTANNPEQQRHLAASHLSVAKILYQIGSTPAAGEALDKAVRTQQALVKAQPADRDLRRGLFKMYRAMGIIEGKQCSAHLDLLRSTRTQSELDLTDHQIALLDDLRHDEQNMDRLLESTKVEPSEIKAVFERHARDRESRIRSILSESQMRRMDQIVLQYRGSRAFDDATIIAELGLTAEQQEQIRAIQNNKPKCASLCDVDEQIFDIVLTAEQVQKWESFVGPKFAFSNKRCRF